MRRATWLVSLFRRTDLQLRDSTGLRLIIEADGTGFAFEPSHPGDRAPQSVMIELLMDK